ncbi:MAG TPA: 2-hydroxyacyl-CoA dehydratase family protein [Syntrophorhabdales bacterium]|nr:2-hydroxyacyl-CoA dehydratase family protein [Syntrophorhabdales bacterium]
MAYTLKAWPDFKNYQNTCYRNYLFAPEGLRVMGSTWSVLAPLKGLGDDIYLLGGEPHAASLAGTLPEESRENILAAEGAGMGYHSCSYLKLFTGEVIRDKIGITDGTIKEGYPKPDLIWTTHLCNQHSKWYQEVSRRLGGVPFFPIDMIGGGNAEKDPKIVNYVSDQMEEGINWLQKVTGREYSDGLFAKAVRNEIKVLVLWGNICALNRSAPAPLDERRLIALFPPAVVDRTTDESVRLYEMLFKEVKEMVRTGQSVAPDQRFRIVYFGIAHTYGHPEMARILRDVGAEIVASVYTFGTCGNFKGIVNGKWSWDPIDPAWVDNLDLSTRRKAVEELAKIVLGWPTWQGVRSWWALESMAHSMIDEFKADGLLLAPSRSCETDFRNGYVGLQRVFKSKIPTIEYDTDQVDVRQMDLPGAQRKTELFVHLMEAAKRRSA